MSYHEIVLLTLIGASVADIVSTNRVLEDGGKEANPVVAKIMAKLGGLWFLVKMPIVVGFGYLVVTESADVWSTLVAWCAALAYTLAAAHNFRVNRKQKQ